MEDRDGKRQRSPEGSMRGNGPKRQPETHVGRKELVPAVQIIERHQDTGTKTQGRRGVFILEDILKQDANPCVLSGVTVPWAGGKGKVAAGARPHGPVGPGSGFSLAGIWHLSGSH